MRLVDIPENQWPDKITWRQLEQAEREEDLFLVERNGIIFVSDYGFASFERYIPIQDAVYFHGTLANRRMVPSKKEREAFPAVYSWAAVEGGDILNPLYCLVECLEAFAVLKTSDKGFYLARNPLILSLVERSEEVKETSRITHDIRIQPLLEEWERCMHFPIYRSCLDIPKVASALYVLQVMVSWYYKPALYHVRKVFSEQSVSYSILSSSFERAEMDFASDIICKNEYPLRYDFLENDNVLFSVFKDAIPLRYYQLAELYEKQGIEPERWLI